MAWASEGAARAPEAAVNAVAADAVKRVRRSII